MVIERYLVEKNGKHYSIRENEKSWTITTKVEKLTITFNVKKTDCQTIESIQNYILTSTVF